MNAKAKAALSDYRTIAAAARRAKAAGNLALAESHQIDADEAWTNYQAALDAEQADAREDGIAR